MDHIVLNRGSCEAASATSTCRRPAIQTLRPMTASIAVEDVLNRAEMRTLSGTGVPHTSDHRHHSPSRRSERANTKVTATVHGVFCLFQAHARVVFSFDTILISAQYRPMPALLTHSIGDAFRGHRRAPGNTCTRRPFMRAFSRSLFCHLEWAKR